MLKEMLMTKAMLGDNGGGGGSTVLVVDEESVADYTQLNKTWDEINDAAPLVWLVKDGVFSQLQYVNVVDGEYKVEFCDTQNGKFYYYSVDSANSKPISSGEFIYRAVEYFRCWIGHELFFDSDLEVFRLSESMTDYVYRCFQSGEQLPILMVIDESEDIFVDGSAVFYPSSDILTAEDNPSSIKTGWLYYTLKVGNHLLEVVSWNYEPNSPM